MANYYLSSWGQALQHVLFINTLNKMAEEEKLLYQEYYQPDHLRTGRKTIKELHKITSVSKKDIKSWLAKQALWEVHVPPPKEINYSHYDLTKPNELHQFD